MKLSCLLQARVLDIVRARSSESAGSKGQDLPQLQRSRTEGRPALMDSLQIEGVTGFDCLFSDGMGRVHIHKVKPGFVEFFPCRYHIAL